MGHTSVEDSAVKSKPTIVVPPRGSMESLFTNGLGGIGFSPGPMTLVSNFFAEQGPFSFSQLLAGAIASPATAVTAKTDFLGSGDGGREESVGNCDSVGDGKEGESGGGGGYKRNRPMNLVVAPPQQLPESLSPLFMVPPGLSPTGMLNSPGLRFLSPLQSPFGMSHQQALAQVTAQAAFSQSYMQMHAELQRTYPAPLTEPLLNHSSPAPSETITEQMNPAPTDLESSKIESVEVSQSDRKTAYVAGDKPANDGYNWRKYGQKHVKASECPRSYYKCTYQNCPVKKKVERSLDGRVSEIVYKGEHNHSPPQSNKRQKDASVLDRTTNSLGFETNIVDEGVQESIRTKQEPFSGANQNDETEGSVIVLDDENDDEPVAKRRNMDNEQTVPASSHQTTTESKIVVQTRSEVDLLDDGYKWRKYGQKVVKRNPHPRSYYRCTYAGCNVRKHVERSSADPKAVITTYEGKHNHELPAGRYGSSNLQSKSQKISAKEPLPSREMEFGSQAPITLHLKEEQIAA